MEAEGAGQEPRSIGPFLPIQTQMSASPGTVGSKCFVSLLLKPLPELRSCHAVLSFLVAFFTGTMMMQNAAHAIEKRFFHRVWVPTLGLRRCRLVGASSDSLAFFFHNQSAVAGVAPPFARL